MAQVRDPDSPAVLDTYVTWAHRHFPSKGAHFRPTTMYDDTKNEDVESETPESSASVVQICGWWNLDQTTVQFFPFYVSQSLIKKNNCCSCCAIGLSGLDLHVL